MNKKINILALLLLSANPILIQAKLKNYQKVEVAGISAVGGVIIAGLLNIAYDVWKERRITKAKLEELLKSEANKAKLRAAKESGSAADALEKSSYNLQELADGIDPLEGEVDGLGDFLDAIKVKGVLRGPVEQTLKAYVEDPATNGPEIIEALKENPNIKSAGLSNVVGELSSMPEEPTIDPKAIEAAKAEFEASVDNFLEKDFIEQQKILNKIAGFEWDSAVELGDSGQFIVFEGSGDDSGYKIVESAPEGDPVVTITPDEFADVLA